MSWLSGDSTLISFLVGIGVFLSVAAVVFLILSVVEKQDWGNAAVVSAMLVIAIFGWIFGLQEGYVGNPELEITDQIETTGGGNLYITWVMVLNRGTGTARNCVVEIEHRTTEEKEYKYLGYALFQRERFMPHTESKFWLVRAISYDEGAHWETCVMRRDIKDYADQDNNVASSPMIAGDHYLKLTMIAENAASYSREFKLHVSQAGTELPKLEALPQNQVQAEH